MAKKQRNHHAVGAWQRKAGPHGKGKRPDPEMPPLPSPTRTRADLLREFADAIAERDEARRELTRVNALHNEAAEILRAERDHARHMADAASAAADFSRARLTAATAELDDLRERLRKIRDSRDIMRQGREIARILLGDDQ